MNKDKEKKLNEIDIGLEGIAEKVQKLHDVVAYARIRRKRKLIPELVFASDIEKIVTQSTILLEDIRKFVDIKEVQILTKLLEVTRMVKMEEIREVTGGKDGNTIDQL